MSEPVSLTVVYQQDGPWIVAWIVEMPAVMTQGATIEEARENLAEALRLTLEVQREQAETHVRERPAIHRDSIPVSLPA
jgi:predicted RNase H-like HicB family nuclease